MRTAKETPIRASFRVTAQKIDAWLPQTQCTRCGYPRCREYALAIAAGRADINQCPPGGAVTIRAIADLLGTAPKPLDPAFGEPKSRMRAEIDERLCIGCRKCLDVCPVDAIVGARKRMHTIIEAECSGCELCLPPCPVDCISLVPITRDRNSSPWPEYDRPEADRWRARTEARLHRLERHKLKRASLKRSRLPPGENTRYTRRDHIKAEIRAAVERVRRKRNST